MELIEYIIMCAPALVTIITAICSIIAVLRKVIASKDDVNAIKEQAIKAFEEIKNNNEIKELKNLCKSIVDENIELKKALIDVTEALTRIRNKHPELFKEGE